MSEFLRSEGEESKLSSSPTELSPEESEGGKEARLFDFAIARENEGREETKLYFVSSMAEFLRSKNEAGEEVT